ncbi:MAG: hypothetical protein AAF702_35835 [Chloroflexota bacterium]
MIEANLPDRIPHPFDDIPAFAPITIPELDEVVQFGIEKHLAREPWRGNAFGWPAEYRVEENLPAGFYVGVNSIYFVALDWEFGSDEEPLIHIEGDYGYDFDENAQIERIKSHRQDSLTTIFSRLQHAE